MTSTSLNTILVVIFAVVLVDVFCVDVDNSRQTRPWQNTRNSEPKSSDVLSDAKGTTPWPSLGQRVTTSSNLNRNTPTPSPKLNSSTGRRSIPTTQSPRKWIQQNNMWIKNEQAASGGNEGAPQNIGINQNRPGVRGTASPQRVSGSVPKSATSSSAKPPLNRGDTYTVLKPQIHQNNRQHALINGLGGNQQNLDPINPILFPEVPNNPVVNTSPKSPVPTTKKPISYADVVSKSSISPSPAGPKTGPVSSPLNPEKGGSKQGSLPSTGPVHDNVKDLEDDPTPDPNSDATDDELREFSESLLRKDTNNAMKYVTLNLQGMTSSRSSNDEALLPLLQIEKEAYKIPSIEKLMLLYNNYFLDAGQNEVYTGQERIEENNLLDAVLATPVMQFARSFLVQKGKIGKDPKEFKDLMRLIWFNMYSRGNGRIGSSGFEHVYVAEIKNNQVSGLHNWIYFNEEESQKRANYLGYLKKLDLGEKGAILKYHFTFHDIDKPVGSMFIGTSPELEMALYSTCFVLRADRICPLKMNGNRFIIRTYTYRYRGKNMIGSAFPEI